MNTYRTFLLDTTDVENPTVAVAFFQATKYSDAWSGARAVVAKKETARQLFVDPACTEKLALGSTENLVVAKILDCTVRNKKLDKATLADILADTDLTDAERLEKITRLSR